jgi:general secretion pathway protein A
MQFATIEALSSSAPPIDKGEATAASGIRASGAIVQADERYLEHFGLAAPPFGPAPDPDLLFWSAAHRIAAAALDFGLASGAQVTVLTGEIGSGKTTLLAHVLRGLDDGVTAGLVATPRPGCDILARLIAAFGLPPSEGHPFDALGALLHAEARAGRRLLAVIDEAQNLSPAALEDLRLMGNLAAEGGAGVELLLVGQPPLLRTLRAPELAPFAQRVATARHLGALDPEEVGGYIASRLQAAGGEPRIFSRQAAELVHRATGGLPRLVNQLCDLALTYAAAAEASEVRRAAVVEVLQDGSFFAFRPEDTGGATDGRARA